MHPFKWTEECQEAFVKLKEHLSQSPVLIYPDVYQAALIYPDVYQAAQAPVLIYPDVYQAALDVYQAALMRRRMPKHACLQIVLYIYLKFEPWKCHLRHSENGILLQNLGVFMWAAVPLVHIYRYPTQYFRCYICSIGLKQAP